MPSHSILGTQAAPPLGPPARAALLASSLRLGGAEKQTVYLARALVRAGIDARFYYLGNGGYYESAVRQSGIPFIRLHLPHQPWRRLVRVSLALCRWRPRFLLAAQFDDLLYGALAGRCCRALVIGGVRSDGFYELRSHGRLSRWLAGLAHGLLANSHHARNNLVSCGVEPRKIQVLPNVIDLPEFDARAALAPGITLPSDRVMAAAVGSLQPGKRFDRFLEALALARRVEPGLAGVIVGADGGAKRGLEARAEKLGLTPCALIFLGETDRIPALLTRSAMLVLSSEAEGFPNVILEAMAARLPVISTPAGDANLIVQHGQTGFLVAKDEPQALAQCLVRLARSPSLRASLGAAGRRRVEREYSFEQLPDRLVAVMQRFAGRHHRHGLREQLRRGVDTQDIGTLDGFALAEPPVA